jgi:hypothetical protein
MISHAAIYSFNAVYEPNMSSQISRASNSFDDATYFSWASVDDTDFVVSWVNGAKRVSMGSGVELANTIPKYILAKLRSIERDIFWESMKKRTIQAPSILPQLMSRNDTGIRVIME